MTVRNKLNKTRLLQQARDNHLLRDFFQMISEHYHINRRELTLKNIHKHMVELGSYDNEPKNKRAIWVALAELEACHCGERIRGRHGHQTRFRFFYDMLDIAEFVLASSDDIHDSDALYREIVLGDAFEPAEADVSEAVRREGGEELWHTHSYRLRRQYDFLITLPYDLTWAQSERLSNLVLSAALNETDAPTDETGEEELEYLFYLNKDEVIEILLPNDLKSEEAGYLSSFLSSLSRESDMDPDWD